MAQNTITVTKRRASVTATPHTAALRDGTTVVIRYEITSSSGYQATLPACPCDADLPGRVLCPQPYGHSGKIRGAAPECDGQSGRRFCHGWHPGSVRRFTETVLATYGAKPPAPKTGGLPRGNRHIQQAMGLHLDPGPVQPGWTATRVAAELGLTADEYYAELARARQ